MRKTKGIHAFGCLMLALVPGSALAQTAPDTGQEAQTGTPETEQVVEVDETAAEKDDEAIVVTGTRIVRPNMTSNAPVTVIDREFLNQRGLARIEDALSQVPQITPMLGLQETGWTAGPARVSLRRLGAGRTLTLLNGQRMENDVGIVPGALIERIDILTGGASAVYGSDAIAGVVNFIVNRKFNGLVIDGEISANHHVNNNQFLKDLQAESGYPTPAKSYFGGANYFLSAATGRSFLGGDLNISGFVTYKEAEPMPFTALDTTGCALLMNDPFSAVRPTPNDRFTCSFSEYNRYNYFNVAGENLTNALDGSRAWREYDDDDVTRVPRTDYLQRADNTINAGGFVSANIVNDITFDGNFLFTRYNQRSANSVNDAFYTPNARVNCDNPFLGAQQAQALCGNNAGVVGAFSDPITAVGWRENFTQRLAYRNVDWRGSANISGTLVDSSRFQLSYQRSRNLIRNSSTDIYTFDPEAFNRTLQVRNVNGVATCLSVIDGSDPACRPYDIFSANSPPTAELLGYLTGEGNSRVESTLEVMSATLSGTLGEYGLTSPFAKDAIGYSIHVEQRHDRIISAGAGAWSVWSNYDGKSRVREIAYELEVPLVQGKRFIEDLSINGAYRISDYTVYDKLVETWKAEISYAPFAGLRARASYNKSLRVPVLPRLEGENRYANVPMRDLCAPPREGNGVQRYSFEQCAAGGMTRQQYDALSTYAACDANGFCPTTLINGGNPALQPERGRSYTFGMVAQPAFLPGFNATVDFYDIDIEGAFEWVRTDLIFDQCYNSRVDMFCGLYRRDPQNGQLLEVDARYQNSGYTATRGIDVSMNYALDPAKLGIRQNIGKFNINFNGTRTLKFEQQFAEGADPWSCLGYFGFICGSPSPVWRHNVNVGWQLPWVKANLNVNWRYFAPTEVSKNSSDSVLAGVPNVNDTNVFPLIDRLRAGNYFDAAFNVQLHKNLNVRFNVQNLLDTDPPLVGIEAGSYLNTYPAYYDARGRTVRLGINIRY